MNFSSCRESPYLPENKRLAEEREDEIRRLLQAIIVGS